MKLTLGVRFMAERPDYEKGIALLSAPAEGLLWVDADTTDAMGVGAGGPATELVHVYAPAGTVAEVVGMEFWVDEPDTWVALDQHMWRVYLGSGLFLVFEDRHAFGSTPPDIGWDFATAALEYLAGSVAGYPIPSTAERQFAWTLPMLVCTPTESIAFRYIVPSTAGTEQYSPRYRDLLLRIKAVS